MSLLTHVITSRTYQAPRRAGGYTYYGLTMATPTRPLVELVPPTGEEHTVELQVQY